MLNNFAGNAITAKARAIYGHRLRANDYQELLKQHSVADIAAYLKTSTNYSQYLKGINEVSVHRGQLESLLNRSLFEKFFGLCHFDFSSKHGFYRYVITNAEITVILSAITHLNSNSSQDIITNIPTFIQKYACFDFLELSKIKNFNELLLALKKTPYKEILSRYDAENGKIDMSSCDLSLKTYYYKSMLDAIDKNYKGKIRRDLRETVLIEIEILNFNLIYRLRRHFKMEPAEVKCHLLPFYYKITPRSLDLLINDETREEFIRHMKLNAYNFKMKDVTFSYVEDYTKRLLYLIVHRAIHFSSNSAVAFFSLMALTRIEIENITTIIEGIRYEMSSQELQKIIISE